jgi:hypothetical protein
MNIVNNQDTEADDLTLKLENLKKDEKNRVKRIKVLENEVTKMTSELEKPVKTEKMEDVVTAQVCLTWATRLLDIHNFALLQRELNLERHEVVKRHEDLQDRQKTNVNETSKHKIEIDARLKEYVTSPPPIPVI